MTLRLGVKTDAFFKECRSEGVTLRLGLQTDAFFKECRSEGVTLRLGVKTDDFFRSAGVQEFWSSDGCLTRKCLLTPSNFF
ncbi:MAG: hypothetical protein IKK92_06345 [Prevotella sp.]|nr:hypothetical protein [Prevotella sp.]